MVQRCNAVGVRIYVDAVMNHMGVGGKLFDFSPLHKILELFLMVFYPSKRLLHNT